jgi:hypothetical protein
VKPPLAPAASDLGALPMALHMQHWLFVLLPAWASAAVVFEIFPSPTCSMCHAVLQEGFLPLLQADLPGDQVQAIVVPWPCAETVERLSPDGIYKASPDDPYDKVTSPQVCALRSNLGQPVPINSPALLGAVKYMLCDFPASSSRDNIRGCAAQAGLPYEGPDGLQICKNPNVGYDLMRGAAYSQKVATMRERPDTLAPHLFVNGEPLICSAPTYCDSIMTAQGQQRMLRQPGTLKDVACSLLDPPPPACQAVGGPAPAAPPPTTTFCENCWEVGAFRWSTEQQTQHATFATAFLIGGSLCCVVVAGGLVFWRLLPDGRSRPPPYGPGSAAAPDPSEAGATEAGSAALLAE